MSQDEMLRKRILRYLSGEMPSKEARAFEEEMLEDPFLSDAVEGLQQEASLPRLQAELAGVDLALKHKGGRKSRMPYYSIAAVFLLLIGTALVIRLRVQETKEASPLASEQVDPMENEKAVTSEAMPEVSKKTIIKDKSDNPSEEKSIDALDKIVMSEEAISDASSGASNLPIQQKALNKAPERQEELSFQTEELPSKVEDLLINPDVADQLLAWAESIKETPTNISSGKILETAVPEAETKKKTESGVRMPVASSTEATINSSGHYERRLISGLIREGKWKEADQAISRYVKTWPDDKSIYILKSGLELKQGNKTKAIHYLKSLKNTPYEKEAKEFEKKIGG